MKVKETKSVSMAEAREILEARAGEGELGYEQSQALEHSESFSKLDSKKVEKLVASLTKHEKVTEELALKIIDISPDNPATLKAIFAVQKIEITDDEAAAILKELS